MGKRSKEKNNPFAGILLGFILIILGTILLWWNEGNNVKNIQTVKEISKNVIDVSSNTVSSENEGKVICTNGNIQVADEIVLDPIFNVGTKTAKLTRTVEMYQWEEDEHTDSDDNSKSYSYSKKWSSDLIDSSSFHESGHENTNSMPYENIDYYANDVSVGEFNLSQNQIKKLSTKKELPLDQNVSLKEGYKVSGKYITNSEDDSNPKIGDIRISFTYNDYTQATVLAVQRGNSFEDFVSNSGKSVNRVDEGLLNSEQVIKKMTDENNALKWGLRLLGVVLLILGYLALFSFISNLASYIPILGSLVGAAVGVVSLLLGLVHSILVIAIAWIRFRPILGLALIAIAIAIIVYINKYVKSKQTE